MSDSLLSELLLRWEELRDKGQPITAGELCREYPNLLDALQRRIDALQVVDRQLHPALPVSGQKSHVDLAPVLSIASTTDVDRDPGGLSGEPVRMLGRFRLDEMLGQGSFGEVGRAYDPDLQRAVAIKIPRLDRWNSAVQAERFLSEARKIARLDHAGILSIYEVGRDSDRCFIVTPLMSGTDLAGRLRHGPIDRLETVRLVARIAEGIVHRDVKPANILLQHTGSPAQLIPKLADFGLALAEEERPDAPGGVLGTYAYMAPEQARGQSDWVDGRRLPRSSPEMVIFSINIPMKSCSSTP